MPIIRSAIKKLRQDKKRTAVNILIKKQTKEAIKLYKRAPSPALLTKVYRKLDMASKKHVFHSNKSDRLKSRLSKLLKSRKSTASSKND